MILLIIFTASVAILIGYFLTWLYQPPKEKKLRVKLVGFHGAKGSGKNTSARVLSYAYQVEDFAFAVPLKKAARAIFGFDYDQLYGDKRRLLVKSGRINITEKLKAFYGHDLVAVTDVRFENEAKLIHELGGIIIQLERGPYVEPEHESEKPLPPHLVDHVVDNNGTMEELQQKLQEILEEE
jgi:hypothetical protein